MAQQTAIMYPSDHQFLVGVALRRNEGEKCSFQASLPGPALLRTPFIPNAHGRMSGNILPGSFPGDSVVKNLAVNPGDSGLIPGFWKIPLRRKQQPSPVFWKIPPTEEPGRLLPMGSQKNQTWLSAHTNAHTHADIDNRAVAKEERRWERRGAGVGLGDANYAGWTTRSYCLAQGTILSILR